VRLLALSRNVGKMEAINQAWPLLGGEVVILTDATAEFDPGAVRELCRYFTDSEVGAVSGALFLREELNSGLVNIDAYWRLEKIIRKKESLIGSVIGATGAIWAIRRHLFVPQASDTILDDVMLPLEVIKGGGRVVFAEKAIAFEKNTTSSSLEFRRKVRTLCGNYQTFARAPWIFNPAYGIALQVSSHKLARLLIPFILPVLLLGSLFGNGYLQIMGFLQIIFYLMAGLGYLLSLGENKPPRILGIPFTFCLLNIAAFQAAVLYFLFPHRLRWK